jgi:pimeloyl-ACP methyl ester carboxylesterase
MGYQPSCPLQTASAATFEPRCYGEDSRLKFGFVPAEETGMDSSKRVGCYALVALIVAAASANHGATQPAATEPYGIALEGFPYPYPVSFLPIEQQGERLRMAYMDVAPTAAANGRTVLLLHGRNFPSAYWQGTIEALTAAGYRVVAPDQIGFNKSSKPSFDLHFDQLARNTAALLDALGIDKVSLVGHSMGGMLSVRIARTFPRRIDTIVLVAPIGLEDYRLYVTDFPADRLMEIEDKVTAESFFNQLMKGYSVTLSEAALAPYLAARTRIKESAEYPRWLRTFVNSALMIWREPVAHEISLLQQKLLFVMGGNDHLAPGRDFAPEDLRAKMGQSVKLAQDLAAKLPNARVDVFEGIGHLPHLEAPERFHETLLRFLAAE